MYLYAPPKLDSISFKTKSWFGYQGSGLATGTSRLNSELLQKDLKDLSIPYPQNTGSKTILSQKGIKFPTVNIPAKMTRNVPI